MTSVITRRVITGRRHCYNLNKLIMEKYSVKRRERKTKSSVKALQHFDDFYSGLFGTKWPSIRLALLSKPKHMAVLNNFGDVEETEKILREIGAVNVMELLKKKNLRNIKNIGDIENNESVREINSKEKEEKHDLKNVNLNEYDNEIENNSPLIKHEDINNLYCDDASEAATVLDASVSMNTALGQSKIDTSRIIDPSEGHDTGALYDFIPATELKGLDDYILPSDYYRFYKVNDDIPVKIETQNEVEFPQYLKVHCFPRGDVSSFPKPRRSKTGVYNYYPLDGASILVVLALGLKPGDNVLDMCAAPGGKSLTIIQTLLSKRIVCNDSSLSRINRMKKIFRQYIYDSNDTWKDMISVTHGRAEDIESINEYDKILVDVPCTVDRHSATVDENNIFRGDRIRERLQLPEYQTMLLEHALKIVKKGGTVVYATCSLSPIQNEGVVSTALCNVWNNHRMEFTVSNLNPAMEKYSSVYRFARNIGLKYGTLVVPFMPMNFGPMYFSKIVKNTSSAQQ